MAGAPHILIVEDQESTAEMLISYFRAQGYKVTAVDCGRDALDFVETNIPDLVVLDIRLPDIDGYEVCRQMHDHRRTENVPVIFLTERRERKDKLAGLELGAVDYITKPFDVQELRLRIRNVLRRSSFERLSHPITGLPTASLAEERLRELLTVSDWAVLSVEIQGLKGFADSYGFVARDDVVRAVALMLGHVVSESHDTDAFLGHLDDTSFFVVIAPDKVKQVRDSLTVRLSEAMSFFYPRLDWEAGQSDPDAELPRLNVTLGVLTSSACSVSNLRDFKRAILESRGSEI